MESDCVFAKFFMIIDMKFAKTNVESRYSLIISANIMKRRFSGNKESEIAIIVKCTVPLAKPQMTYVEFAKGLEGRIKFTVLKKSDQRTRLEITSKLIFFMRLFDKF